MELKVPPVMVAAILGVLMWGVDQYIHSEFITFSVWKWVYWLVFGMGILVGLAGVYQFIKHKTTVDPHNVGKAITLVTGGIYRFTRNPMYLALVMCLLGFGLKLGNVLSLILIPLFVIYMNHFQIKPEERVLRQKFGKQFTSYAKQVRRWI